jgi:hypothetical protein
MTTASPATPEPSPIADPKAAIAAAVDAAKPSVEITEDDRISAAVAKALDAERKATAEKLAKDKEAADLAAAKEQGKWKEIAEAAEKKATEAEHLLAVQRADTTLTDHLAADHPDYLPRKKYIAPLIPTGLAGDELIKAVKSAVAEFVKDNPIQPKGSNGAPPPLKPTRADVGAYPPRPNTEARSSRFGSLNWNG